MNYWPIGIDLVQVKRYVRTKMTLLQMIKQIYKGFARSYATK